MKKTKKTRAVVGIRAIDVAGQGHLLGLSLDPNPDPPTTPEETAILEVRARWSVEYLRRLVSGETCARRLLEFAVDNLDEVVRAEFGRIGPDGRRFCAHKAVLRGVERSCVQTVHSGRHAWVTSRGEFRFFPETSR